jgi:hypothetical protein
MTTSLDVRARDAHDVMTDDAKRRTVFPVFHARKEKDTR